MYLIKWPVYVPYILKTFRFKGEAGRSRGCVVEEGQRGGGTSISLPKTLSCISGCCLEAWERAKRVELRGRLTAAQRTLRHLTIGTAIQTTHTYTDMHTD